METLLILGAGGFGRVAAETALAAGVCDRVLFLDDAATAPDVVGTLADYERLRPHYPAAAVAIGSNTVRLDWLQKLKAAGYSLPVLVHPRAYVSPSAQLGAGCVVLPGAVVNTGARAGEGCIINCNAVLDHNCTLGNAVHACLGSIIKAGAVIEPLRKIEAGQIVRSPWEK